MWRETKEFSKYMGILDTKEKERSFAAVALLDKEGSSAPMTSYSTKLQHWNTGVGVSEGFPRSWMVF